MSPTSRALTHLLEQNLRRLEALPVLEQRQLALPAPRLIAVDVQKVALGDHEACARRNKGQTTCSQA